MDIHCDVNGTRVRESVHIRVCYVLLFTLGQVLQFAEVDNRTRVFDAISRIFKPSPGPAFISTCLLFSVKHNDALVCSGYMGVGLSAAARGSNV